MAEETTLTIKISMVNEFSEYRKEEAITGFYFDVDVEPIIESNLIPHQSKNDNGKVMFATTLSVSMDFAFR